MPAARPALLPRFLTAGVVALLAMMGTLAGAAPASAHDQLLSSDPADGSTVQTMPAEIMLSFSAAVQTLTEDDTYVDVLAPSGENLAAGAEVIDGATIRQPVSPATEAGTYTVEWRAVSSDGHPIADTFTFTVQRVSAPEESGAGAVAPENDETATAPPPKTGVTPTPIKETPSATDSATPSPAPAADDEDRSFGEVLPWILLGLTAMAIVGALVAVLVARARGGDEETPDEDTPAQG